MPKQMRTCTNGLDVVASIDLEKAGDRKSTAMAPSIIVNAILQKSEPIRGKSFVKKCNARRRTPI
jgi:hypothetical protein